MSLLGRRLLEVGNDVRALDRLLEAGEHHLGAGDVLLRVEQVLEQSVVRPCDSLLLVRVSVVEALGAARLACKIVNGIANFKSKTQNAATNVR